MKTTRFLSLSAIFAITFTFFACSSDSPSGASGGESSPSQGQQNPSSSSAYIPPPPPSSSSVYVPPPPSSSSIVVQTQYYDVVLGNWSTSCPNLNDYPEWRNNVIAIDASNITTMQSCLINSESYRQKTSSEVSNFLATNGLSGYANDFNLRIAASSYNAAFLIYTNTSNYFRVLIIGYSDSSQPTPSSSSAYTPPSSTCDSQCARQIEGSMGTSLYSSAFCNAVANNCGTACKANYSWCR
jgi:hypothetical protein